MTHSKSYTSLEQSKVLADILPLESADMNWHELLPIGCYARTFPYKKDNGATEGILPCWSLSALLNVLPDKICFDKETYYLNCNKKKVEYLGPMTYDGQKSLLVEADNLVDTCYEMITKFKEKNLL